MRTLLCGMALGLLLGLMMAGTSVRAEEPPTDPVSRLEQRVRVLEMEVTSLRAEIQNTKTMVDYDLKGQERAALLADKKADIFEKTFTATVTRMESNSQGLLANVTGWISVLAIVVTLLGFASFMSMRRSLMEKLRQGLATQGEKLVTDQVQPLVQRQVNQWDEKLSHWDARFRDLYDSAERLQARR